MTQTLKVRILSPFKVLFDSEALAVSSVNSTGKFDILPQHANFITIIENQKITVLKTDKTTQDFSFKEAIILSVADKVSIYTDPQSLTTPGA